MAKNEYKDKTRYEYHKEWVNNNRTKQKNYQKDLYYRKKQYLLENVGSSCAWCGSTEDIEFDHLQPSTTSEKEKRARMRTGNMGGNLVWNKRPTNMGWEQLKAEVPKLQPLCKCCHRKKSNAQLAAAWEAFCSLTLEQQTTLTQKHLS